MSRHFNYFPDGGPYPSTCVGCGNNKELFHLGRELPFKGGAALLCKRCVTELAETIGYTDPTTLEEELEELSRLNVSHETSLNRIPNLVEGLIDGIRGQLTDFIFAVSYDDLDGQSEDVQNDPTLDLGNSHTGPAEKPKPKTPKQSVSK